MPKKTKQLTPEQKLLRAVFGEKYEDKEKALDEHYRKQADSVTNEEFEKTWGIKIEEHNKKMMTYVAWCETVAGWLKDHFLLGKKELELSQLVKLARYFYEEGRLDEMAGVSFSDRFWSEKKAAQENTRTPEDDYTFVDLGLPSGTLWADGNVPGLRNWYEAKKEFDGFLPSREDFIELLKHCHLEWLPKTKSPGKTCSGLKVTGPNGNSIFLPAEGMECSSPVGRNEFLNYWSGTRLDEEHAFFIDYKKSGLQKDCFGHFGCRFSVRLIKK